MATITVFTRMGSVQFITITCRDKDQTDWTLTSLPTNIKDGRKKIISAKSWGHKNDYFKRVESDDESVVKVSWTKDAVTLTPKNVGKTNVTITTKYGYTKTFTVTVKKSSFKLQKAKLTFKDLKKQTVDVKSFALSDPKIISVASDNEKIATVSFKNETITIKPHKEGTTTIRVYTKKNVATIKVIVK